MSVVSEIERIKTNISNAYTELEGKGATIPTEKNSANLPNTIASIQSGGGDLSEYFKTTDFTIPTSSKTLVDQALLTLPPLDTTNLTDFSNSFNGSYITQAPQMNTSNGTKFYYMFGGCSNLIFIPLYDTSKGTDFSYMFWGCSKLETFPILNTSNGTNFNNMYNNCQKMTTVPEINTSNGTNFSNMFYDCRNLRNFPSLNTSNGTNFSSMFRNMSLLQTIGLLDFGSATNISNMLYSCSFLISVDGFKDLGKGYLTTQSANYNNYMLNISSCYNLTHNSIMNIINNVYDIASLGCQPQKIRVHANTLALLSEEEIAIATNKGWTVATS